MASRVNVEVGFSIDKSGLSQMQSLFQQIVNKAKEPGQQLNQGLQQAATTANTLDSILEKTFNTDLGTLNVTKFNQELSKSGLTLKQVQADLSKAGSQGSVAYNRLAQGILGTNIQLKESNKLLDSMATTMANTVKWGITSSIFNSITQAISKAVTYAKQLDTSLNDIRIVTDKSANSMAEFAEQANAAAKEMGASTLDYTNAALIYYQQGLSDEETKARAETTIKAANVTGQTGQEVSEQLTAVWNGYKVTAQETELYVDKLAAVAATTAADLEELSTGMSKVAAAANAMGVDFDDLNAQIATIVSVTRQAPESVGTALKTIYARLGDLKVDGIDEFGVKLGEVSAQMKAMGIQILDENGDLRNMSSVIAEVAEKWNTWTRAQQQAAAIAMAGKRQYNNLVALFENWDMYSEALETSTEAMGTLQHQQDIYMESTAGKLKVLKATWQDFYGDLIDNDELNVGIRGLTDLVQVFDNFIESFGGGIKSIVAFGAIVTNIFNKQIVNSINEALHRQEIFKQNLILAQSANQIRQHGALDGNDNDRANAIAENTRVQIEYSQKIFDARVGLNQEQANTLINYQKELGALAEEISYTDSIIKSTELKYLTDVEISDLLTADEEKLSEINAEYGEIEISASNALDTAEMTLKNIKEQLSSNKELADIKENILLESKTLSSTEQSQIKNILSEIDSTESLLNRREEILLIFNKNVSAQKNNLKSIKEEEAAVDRVLEARAHIADLSQKQNNIKQQADDMLEFANRSKITAQNVIGVTSAIGTMTMAWSSMSSLLKTIKDDSISLSDKITQILMTAGMSVPMILSSFKKLSESLGFSSTLLDVINAKKALNTALTGTNITARQLLSGEITKNNLLQAIENNLIKEYCTVEGVSIKDISIETKERIASSAAKQADMIVTNELTAAQTALNTAMYMCPAFWLVGALVAVAAATAAVISNQQKELQNQIDLNKATVERVNKLQEEAETYQKLANEYDKLYQKYKQNKIEKDELYDITNQLCEKYHLEGGYIANLTGDYDKLTASIKSAQKEELKQLQIETKKEVAASEKNVLNVGQQTKAGQLLPKNTYMVTLHTGFSSEGDENEQIRDIFLKNISNSHLDNFNRIITKMNPNDTNAIIKNYEEIQASIDEINEAVENGLIDSTDRSKSEYYTNAQLYVENMKETIEAYKAALDDLDNYKIQSVLIDANLESTESYEDYFKKIEKIKKELSSESFSKTSEEIENLLSIYLNDIDNEFAQIGHGLEELKQQTDLTDEDINKIAKDWSDEDIKLLFSGKINFDGLKTLEDLQAALNVAKNSLSEEDLTVAVSLREKVSSNKKLTKTELKEAAGEQSTLAQDYEIELSDFDNQSQLKQVDTLNKIVEDKIDINKRYIENAKETAKQEKEVEETRFKNLNKEREELEKKKANAEKAGVVFTQEEEDRLKELEQELKIINDKIEDLGEVAEAGLSFDDLNELNYSNLISGIDGIITEAEVLNNLTKDIGKNWTIAADKIENFGKNFPEILENAENYKFLQDGSIQLTEAGKVALKDTLNIRKANLQATNEEYQLELQKQADIQQATADYYNQQADLLEAYLNGEMEAKDAEIEMENNLTDYKKQLMEITGENDAQLNKAIQENLGLTDRKAKNDINDIYDYWCSVGDAAAAASLAYENQSFDPPSFKGGRNASVNVNTNFKAQGSDKAANSLKDLDKNQIEQLINTYRTKAEDASNKAADYISKKIGAGAALKSFENSAENAISGKGNDKSKSSSKDKDKEDKKYDDEFDRYWKIKKAIDAVDKALKRLAKDKENLYGTQLIDALKYENALLEEQKGHYDQLIQAQEQEAAELRGQLITMGIMFDASGAIINYAEATAKALAEYNNAIQQYNAGLIDETTFKVYEKSFENFKKLLERYDTLYYTEIEETKDKIDELNRQKLANNLKSWEVQIQLKLDFKELKRGWNDFLKEISEDFQKVYQDLTLGIDKLINNAQTYIGSDGDIATIINAIHDVTHEIDVMQSGGKSNMFESITQAQEKLKELNEQIQDSAKNLHDLWKEAWENYLNGIDQIADQFDDLMDQFERINDEIEFQGELIELLYGKEAYDLLSNLYKGQERSLENQIQSVKTQTDMWHQLWLDSGATMENQADWTEDQKAYYEQWAKAQSDLNDLIIDYIKLLKTDYLNTIDDILKQLETSITGSSLEGIQIQWERISAFSDKYLDDVEKAYEIQKFSNKINDQISKIDNLKQQQKLTALREKEIAYLREKEHLTQYDLDAAEARYQIALKEMALEDAQNNKTQMKLVRNEQGNWSYQYVADEIETFAKQQELLEAYNNLYQLASDAYEENLESLQELQEKYLDSAKEIYENETLSEEQKEQRLLELREWYFEQYSLLAEENTLYRNDLTTSAAALLLEVYEQDQEAYAAMTETERELIDNLIQSNIDDYMDLEEKMKENLNNINDKSHEVMEETRADWSSSAQLLAELWNKDKGGSVRTEVIDAYNRIQKATEDYKNKVDWLAEATEKNFGPEGIVGAIEEASYATDILNDKTVDLVENGVYYLSILRESVEEIADSWRSVQSEINDAISLLERYISMLSSYNHAVEEHNARIEAAEQANIGIGSAGDGSGSGSSNKIGSNNSDSYSNRTQANYFITAYDDRGFKLRGDGTWNDLTLNQAQQKADEIKQKFGYSVTIQHYASGGYTGSWSGGDNNGRLAVLHQKELVLNKNDTANFLQGISTIRDLSNLNGSISNAIMNSIAGMVASIVSPKANTGTGIINNTNTTQGDNIFNITAEFPNANDVNEIREAIMNLPNLASQYIARNLK